MTPIEDDEDLPSTLRRSGDKAKRTFAKTLNSAEESYGEGERARRTAFASLKHTHEKVGDHWEPKEHSGPSDEQAARGTGEGSEQARPTKGGVDAKGHTKQELLDRAKELGVPGTSKLSKDGLADAIDRANRKATRRAREDERRQG